MSLDPFLSTTFMKQSCVRTFNIPMIWRVYCHVYATVQYIVLQDKDLILVLYYWVERKDGKHMYFVGHTPSRVRELHQVDATCY